jgi:hypothetical protein
MIRNLLATLTLSMSAAPLTLSQAVQVFDGIDVVWHGTVPAGIPYTLSGHVDFTLGPRGTVSPATEDVVVELVPPDLGVPPSPIAWRLLMPAGCFILSRSGQFRLEDFLVCRAQLMLDFADGTTRDVSAQILGLEADFKPPTGMQEDWRFRVTLDAANGQTLPPNPIGGRTRFSVGDDVGEAIHIELSWRGKGTDDDG